MSSKKTTYTYRCGEKILLEKDLTQFVVRSLPERLEGLSWGKLEQVSSASTRVATTPANLEFQMSVSRGIAPTHHAYVEKDSGAEFLITDRVFVRFQQAPSVDELNDFITKYALVLLKQYAADDFLFQLTNYTGMNPVKLVVKLTEDEPLVASAGHDLNKRIQKYENFIPTDQSYLQQWQLHDRLNHPFFDPRSTARCEEAWELLGSYGSNDVVIAITDDGCRLNHDDFNSPNKFAAWGYMIRQRLITNADIQANPNQMYIFGDNHGTSCAGVAAGEADGVKTVGAAPDCRLLPIKWESDRGGLFISDSKLITVLEFLADKVDVISNSWGASPIGNWEIEVVNKIDQLSRSGGRRGKGIVFLWAAGNENCPIEHRSNIDIPYTSGFSFNGIWVGVETSKVFQHNLVQVPGVMHIAALASTAQRSHYSNYGKGISLCASSSNGHTYGRVPVRGLGITTATGSGSGVTQQFGGTSSATPLAAGVAALVISANPNLSALEVISILKQTASKDLNFEAYPKTPPANFNRDTSWDVSPVAPFDNGEFMDVGSEDGTWSPWFGHGKVDAFEAVKAALAGQDGNISEEEIFKQIATVNLAIPDNDVNGITHQILCPNNGSVQSIAINVEIQHTYIGDLEISISSPSNKKLVLHNRFGSSTRNISQQYDFSNTAALRQLIGESTNGNWTLQVRDLAARDTGSLVSWGITLNTASNKNEVIVEENPAISIPDNDSTGVERILKVSNEGNLQAIEVDLDITHSYISDLIVTLLSPNGKIYALHNQTGGSRNNIIRSYTIPDTPALADLLGTPIQGNWKLRIIDNARQDIGKLNYWKLTFTV